MSSSADPAAEEDPAAPSTDTQAVIAAIIDRLKHLIADHGFFCFLADRNYFEEIDLRTSGGSYSVEHTYFSRRVLIVHQPSDLIRYIEELLIGENDGDRLAHAVFGLAVAYRSRLNLADVGRAVDTFITTDETMHEILRPGMQQQLGGIEMRLAATVQLVINEVMLTPPFDVRFRNDPDPRFMQMALDALYFIPRAWDRDARASVRLSEERIHVELLERKCGCVTSEKKAAATTPAKSDEDEVTNAERLRVLRATSGIEIPSDELSEIWDMVALQIELLADFEKLRAALVSRLDGMNNALPGVVHSAEERKRAETLRDIILSNAVLRTKGLIEERPKGTVNFLLDKNGLVLSDSVDVEISAEDRVRFKDVKNAVERLSRLLGELNVDLATLTGNRLLRDVGQVSLTEIATVLRESERTWGRTDRLKNAEEQARILADALKFSTWLPTALLVLVRLRRDLANVDRSQHRSNQELLDALLRQAPIPSAGATGVVPQALLTMAGLNAPPPAIALETAAIDAFSEALAQYVAPELARAGVAP